MTDIESGSITATLVTSQKNTTTTRLLHISYIQPFLFLTALGDGLFLIPAGDAFSEEAERRFEKYPGQLNNQIP